MFIKMYYEAENCIVEVDCSYYVSGAKNNELIPVTFNPHSLVSSAKRVMWSVAKVKPESLYFLEYSYFSPMNNMKRRRCRVLLRNEDALVEIVDEYGWHGYINKDYVIYDPDPIISYKMHHSIGAYLSEGLAKGIKENTVKAENRDWLAIKNYILNDEKVTKELSNIMNNSKFDIKEVKFNGPATVVFWKDGTKTVVKCDPHDKIDYEKGLSMAITKRALGDKGHYYETIKKYAGEEMTKAEKQVHDDIWMAYQALVRAMEDKKATKADLLCAMEEAIGYLGSEMDE